MVPGQLLASAGRIQFFRHVSEIPKSVASRLIDNPGSRLWATVTGDVTTATTASRKSLGYGFGTADTLPAAPHGTTDQMSPTRAADPIELHRRIARGFRNRDTYRLRMLLIGGGLTHPHGK